MINFKKAYNLITACLLIMALVCPSLAYPSENTCLRVPVQIDSLRLNEAIERLSSQGKKNEVVQSIQKLQAQGLIFDTINRKIKQEFDESTYHLQEWIRRGSNDSFYVNLNSEYFEIIDGRVSGIDKATFEQGRRILVKVVRGSYTKEKLVSEVKKVVAKLDRKLNRPPNIRETADAMPGLQTSRNPAALLYKHFQKHKLNPYDYGISRYSGKANLDISENRFLFAGVRVYISPQLNGKVRISADKVPISEETRIDIVDKKKPENRLTVEYIKNKDLLRLTYIQQPSGKKVTEDIPGIRGKTGITLTGGLVFSDFYDAVFSIPLQKGQDRLKAVAEHLRGERFGVSYEQAKRDIDFRGKLILPSWYKTHPGRIKIYRDRENDARFLLLEDVADPDNVVGYEWRENKIVPLENDSELEIDSAVNDLPVYYLHRSDVFRNGFDKALNKSVEVTTATPEDSRQSDVSMGTCRFLFRVKKDVSVVAFEGERSSENITRDDRKKYPIKIYSGEKEIVIKYRNPDVQGEFIIEGLDWEDGSPVVLKGPSGYEARRGYFNISTIVEMLRQGLLPGIKASDLLFETFDSTVGIKSANLKRPIRSYKVDTLESGEKVLVMDVLVDPETFEPWQDALVAENSEQSFLEKYPIITVLRRMRHGGSVYDTATLRNAQSFLEIIAEECSAELGEEIVEFNAFLTKGSADLFELTQEPPDGIGASIISDRVLEDWENRFIESLKVFVEAQKRFAGLKERVFEENFNKESVRTWSLTVDKGLAKYVAILEDGINLTQGVVLKKEIDINETIREAIKPFSLVEFSEGAIPKIYADSMMMGQIVKNIVVNADNLKTKIGITKIIINTELSEDKKEIVVTVTNDGASFDSNMLSSKQEPDGSYEVLFGYGTTYREGGSGFGLAENELYAKLHNGSFRIFSRPSGENTGSTFILRLPIVTRQSTEKLLIQRQSRTDI